MSSGTTGRRAALLTAYDPRVYKGGIERYVLQLMDLLDHAGVAVEIFSLREGSGPPGFHNRLYADILDIGRRVQARQREFDLVISNGFYGVGYFPRQAPTYNIFHATHAAFAEAVRPVIAPVTWLEWSVMCGYLGEMTCGTYANRIAVSPEVARELSVHYGFDSARVVESGVDLDRFRPPSDRAGLRARLGVGDDEFVALFVGRFDVTKGADLLGEVVEATPEVTWLLVLGSGGGECPLAARPNVRIVNEVDAADMPDVYGAADVLFFPSRYEGFGLVVVEAMACGVPVLSAPVGVARSLFAAETYDGCLLPDPADGRAFVAAAIEGLGRMHSQPRRREDLAAEGRRTVEGRFGIDRWRREMAGALDLG